jgi:23S rRNA pseudouridine1911/1915/1917 synthase
MVVAKTLTTMHALVQAIAAREVQRLYRAIALGRVEPDLQDIEAPVGRDPRSRIRMAVLASGKPSRTTVQVVARTNSHSALECRLHTGRTHQIRVHLAHRGHPLVADRLYGGTIELGIERQALHAYRLQFRHPATGDEIACEATPPTDFEQAWKAVHGVG